MKNSRLGALIVTTIAIQCMGFLLAMVVFNHGQSDGHTRYHSSQKPNRLKIVLKNPLDQPKVDLQPTVVKTRKLIGDIYNKRL